MTSEKRRIHRFTFESPHPAKLSGLTVSIVDLSTAGAKIEHAFPLQGGRQSRLEFVWAGSGIFVQCEVVRCRLQKSSLQPGTISYASGLRFTDPGEESRDIIRKLVAELVMEKSRELL